MAGTRLRLRVVPGARRSEIVGRYGEAWKVRVKEPPERGAANEAVLRLLADALGVSAGEVRLVSGHGSRDKIVELTALEADEAEARLSSQRKGRMTTIDTTRFRDALLRERGRVQGALENLHNENPGTVEDETGEETQDQHLGDAATAMHDRSLDYTLEDNEEHLLGSIDAALKRIEDGTYGICTNCGRPISEERLEALPWAELCIDCARRR